MKIMNTLKNYVGNFARGHPKISAAAIIGFSALTFKGTFSDDEGFPFINNVKTGHDWGINIGVYTHIRPGASFSGANFSIITKNDGEIYGLNANVLGTNNNGRINGANISGIANFGSDGVVKGLEGSIGYNESNVDAGLVQVGFYNKINLGKNKTKQSAVGNYKFNGGYKYRKILANK